MDAFFFENLKWKILGSLKRMEREKKSDNGNVNATFYQPSLARDIIGVPDAKTSIPAAPSSSSL